MRLALPTLLAAIAILAPSAAATTHEPPEYPREFLDLLPGLVAATEALATPEDQERPWWNETSMFLDRAKASQAEGRFRVTLFHLETFRELLVGNRLIDEAESDAGGKALILQRTSAVNEEADAAWAAYRAKLHGYDGKLRSLQTIEKALYSADLAIAGALLATDFELLASEFPKQDGVTSGFVFGLVRGSYTSLVNVQWADAVLEKALQAEGVPPQVIEANWTNLTTIATAYGDDEPPRYLEGFDRVARPVRENDEGMLSVALLLAEQRAGRANNMQTIFGDARTRGLDVVNDAARGMRKQFNNTTLDTPRGVGLAGVFTADAIDRAQVSIAYLEDGQADIGTVITAWSALEHQGYVTNALSTVSPVKPPPTPTENGAPGPAAALVVLLVAAIALAARRAPRS